MGSWCSCVPSLHWETCWAEKQEHFKPAALFGNLSACYSACGSPAAVIFPGGWLPYSTTLSSTETPAALWRRAVHWELLFLKHSELWVQRGCCVAMEPRKERIKAVFRTKKTDNKIKPCYIYDIRDKNKLWGKTWSTGFWGVHGPPTLPHLMGLRWMVTIFPGIGR